MVNNRSKYRVKSSFVFRYLCYNSGSAALLNTKHTKSFFSKKKKITEE